MHYEKEYIALHGTTKLSVVQRSSLCFNHLIHCGPHPTNQTMGGRGRWAPINYIHQYHDQSILDHQTKGGKKKLSRTDSTYLPPDFPNSIRLGTRERIERHQEKEDGRRQRRRKSDNNNNIYSNFTQNAIPKNTYGNRTSRKGKDICNCKVCDSETKRQKETRQKTKERYRS